jgi:hypothetical protein
LKIYPLTVGMTPSFRFGGDNDWLLRAQLKCLSEQEFKDFDVLLVDCHYQKRKGYVPELAERYKLNLVHVPYTPNLHVAKKLDCAIFNAPYLFSESERIVRYSCWRFVRPQFTKICVESSIAVDFRFHNVSPPSKAEAHHVTDHNVNVWDLESDVVYWSAIPTRAGQRGASWTTDSDVDAPAAPFPLNCFGNYMVKRYDWMMLNGCDEAIFNSEHWEDQDFCQRAQNAGMKAWRKCHQMYRLHHWYGSNAGRANELPDFGSFKPICPKCEAVEYVQKPNRRELKRRIRMNEVSLPNANVWVCNDCHYCGPVFHEDEGEYHAYLKRSKVTRANVIPAFKLGRNLSALAADMDGKSLAQKVEIFEGSYQNERYYK